jgi:hypothetical protein
VFKRFVSATAPRDLPTAHTAPSTVRTRIGAAIAALAVVAGGTWISTHGSMESPGHTAGARPAAAPVPAGSERGPQQTQD